MKHFFMPSKNLQELEKYASEWRLSAFQQEQLSKYVLLLEDWGRRINLFSKNDHDKLVSRHIYDSLQIIWHKLVSHNSIVLDIGTGAGFPGIPVKILYPSINLTLLDSVRKKALFLQEAAEQLSLTNLNIVCARAEEYLIIKTEKYDSIMTRAVAELTVLWKWCHKVLDTDGKLIALKGGDLTKELNELVKNYPTLNYKILPFQGKLGSERKVVIVNERKDGKDGY